MTNSVLNNQFYGWFDDAAQQSNKPSYDPPHDGPCLYCGKAIKPNDVRTHSMMMQSPSYAKRSYFYRTHRTCDDRQGGASQDDAIWNMIKVNGD